MAITQKSLTALEDALRAVLVEVATAKDLLTTKDEWDRELDRLKAEHSKVQGEVAAAQQLLTARKDTLKAEADKLAKAHAAAEASIQARIDGLLTQERSLEQSIEQKRQTAEQIAVTQERAIAQHHQDIADLQARTRQATAELATAKQKLAAFHAHLTAVR